MKYIKLLFLSLSFAATFTACDMTDFGDINKDPNEPSEANTGMLFTYACTYVKYFSMNSNYYYPWTQMYPGYMSEKNNNQYGAFGGPTMSTSSYYLYPLKNCEKIIDFNSDEAEKGKPAIVQFGDNANQIAVARTLMGFIYMHHWLSTRRLAMFYHGRFPSTRLRTVLTGLPVHGSPPSHSV